MRKRDNKTEAVGKSERPKEQINFFLKKKV